MTVIIQILVLLVLAASGYRIWRRLRYFLHVFQLEGYKRHEYFAWLTGIGRRTVLLKEHAAGMVVILAVTVLAAVTAVTGSQSRGQALQFACSRARQLKLSNVRPEPISSLPAISIYRSDLVL